MLRLIILVVEAVRGLNIECYTVPVATLGQRYHWIKSLVNKNLTGSKKYFVQNLYLVPYEPPWHKKHSVILRFFINTGRKSSYLR